MNLHLALLAYMATSYACSTPKSKLSAIPERDATTVDADGGNARDAGKSKPRALNAPCTGPDDACAEGLSCVERLSTHEGRCKQTCKSSDECESGCCDQAEGLNDSFCVAKDDCACGVLDAKCGSGGTSDCCFGLVCVVGSGSEADTSGLTGCKPPCKENKDCESDCCLLFTGQERGACAPEVHCK